MVLGCETVETWNAVSRHQLDPAGGLLDRRRHCHARGEKRGFCGSKHIGQAARRCRNQRCGRQFTAEVEYVDLVDALGVGADAVGDLVDDGEVQLDGRGEGHVPADDEQNIAESASRPTERSLAVRKKRACLRTGKLNGRSQWMSFPHLTA